MTQATTPSEVLMATMNINKKHLSTFPPLPLSSIKFVSCKKFYLNLNSVLITKFVFSSSLQLKKDFPSFSGHKYIWDVSGFRFTSSIRFQYLRSCCAVSVNISTLSMREGNVNKLHKLSFCGSSACDGREIVENCISRKSKHFPFHAS
jgi:hypothetical protein